MGGSPVRNVRRTFKGDALEQGKAWAHCYITYCSECFGEELHVVL